MSSWSIFWSIYIHFHGAPASSYGRVPVTGRNHLTQRPCTLIISRLGNCVFLALLINAILPENIGGDIKIFIVKLSRRRLFSWRKSLSLNATVQFTSWEDKNFLDIISAAQNWEKRRDFIFFRVLLKYCCPGDHEGCSSPRSKFILSEEICLYH